MLNRRRVLAYGAVVGGALLLPGCGRGTTSVPVRQAGHATKDILLGHNGHGQAVHQASAGPAGEPYAVRMPVPPVLRPVTQGDTDVYRVVVEERQVELLPGLSTTALTFGGSFIGPTIRAKAGRKVAVTYVNQHSAPVNVHLHGGNVPAVSDGHPMDVIAPGASRVYDYPNLQAGATLWYHDHSHHTEAEHVYRGMHGFYLIDDEDEADLGLPAGEYDVPIALRDAHFDENGALVFGDPRLRNTILANGRPQPFFPVAARKYRFRILNCANERTFQLSLGGNEMIQIATDGGLLPAPRSRTEIGLSPGERVEVVVDFSRFKPGDRVELVDPTGPVLRFEVTHQARDRSRVPSRLRRLPAAQRATVTREVTLKFDLSGPAPVGVINGRPFDPARDDFVVRRGTTEIWHVVNGDGDLNAAHNFHMHLVGFQVLDRDGNPPTADDMGRKDTIPLPPGTSARLLVTFDSDYLGRYLYHCHFIEHSSVGMMGQMNVVA